MRRAALFSLAAMAFLNAAIAQAQAKCQLAQIAQWAVRAEHYNPVVDGVINGQKIGVMLDTGAGVSLIHRSAAKKLRLATSPARGRRFFGVGGETQVQEAYIDEFRIGEARYKNWVALVAGEHELQSDVALLLGYDFFHQMDVEFDLPQNKVQLFEPKGCDNAWLAYWSKEAVALPLEAGDKIIVTVRINGKPLLAELDSGATYTSLSLEGALQVGVTPKTAGIASGGCSTGLGRVRVDKWIAPFDSFAIGDEVIRSPKLHFGDLWQHTKREETGSFIARRLPNLPDMLVGADFLRAHRVYVAHSQRKLYVSYAGGSVFPAGGGKPCSEFKD